MKKIVSFTLALMLILLSAAGCASASAAKMYGKDDTKITVGAGDTFSIELEANPTTGYDWKATISDDKVVALVSNIYKATPVDTAIVGSGGVDVITFKGLEKGNAVITLVYERSFEKDSAIQTIVHNITVQ